MKPRARPPRIALALAGGGPLGAIYEIGALCALEEALPGMDLSRLDHYVGVSAGAFIAAGLANRMTPRALHAAFIAQRPGGRAGDELFDPAWLTVPAYGEFARRGIALPGRAASALWRATWGRRRWTEAIEPLGAVLPTGLFANDEVDRRLAAFFSRPGRSNDFRRLGTRLTLVATDLDTGAAAPFGRPGWDAVPISKAVQASSALPGLFPPVEIGDRYFVDGALKKTLHASVALDEGADLLLCLNPLVPFHAAGPRSASGTIPRIVDGGLPAVLSQTFRSMIHSRMELGMKHYERAYPQTDIVLIEPDHADAELFRANTFGYRRRAALAEHAYRQTRAMLRAQAAVLGPKLARHGLALDLARLGGDGALAAHGAPPRTRVGRALVTLDQTMDQLAHTLRPAGA